MVSHAEDVLDEEPSSIDPYEVLGLEKSASADQVKSAYRKAALKHHPDKAPDHLKDEAHKTFQSIAFAYAILSDIVRRKRYDTTGSTAESIVDSDGFSWSEFYNEQFQDVISDDAIEMFAQKYKGSDEEKDDLIIAYKKHKGNMDNIYEVIMLSDPAKDDDRFRAIIDNAIAVGDVESYSHYMKETKTSKERRIRNANKEEQEAMEYAEELGVKDKLFGKGGKGKAKQGGENALMEVILKRQQERGGFLDDLEAKYARPQKPKPKKGKKRTSQEEIEDEDEPSEEAFQQAAAKLKKGKTQSGDTRRSKRSKH